MSDFTMLDKFDDCEQRLARSEAFCRHEVLDRPYVKITFAKQPLAPLSLKESWNRPEMVLEHCLKMVENTEYMGDDLPMIMPNIGPDLFPVLFGGGLDFEESTSYIRHFMTGYDNLDAMHADQQSPYFLALDNLFDVLSAGGRGKFYVGYPDFHPGGDCLAAWRSPEVLCMDLLDRPAEVTKALALVNREFPKVYDYFYQKIQANRDPVGSWMGILSNQKWHISSNDFSYMIGPEEFNDIFLGPLQQECRHFSYVIHHLDGVGCLRHLDALLSLPEIHAVQWVWGAGKGRASDWLAVFQKIQQAGKGMQLNVEPDEISLMMEHLSPRGVQLVVNGVRDRATGEAILRQVARWR